jgi:choline-glycine betaine transporter
MGASAVKEGASGGQGSGQPSASKPDRRGDSAERNLRESLRGLIRDATQSEEELRRHLKLFRFVRSTILGMLCALLLGSLLFGAGIAAVVAIAGIHLAVAMSIGAAGTGTFVATVAIQARRWVRAVLRALSEARLDAAESGAPTHRIGGPKVSA